MASPSPLRGLAQVNLPADDVVAARDWYAKALGLQPYFQQPDADAPAYVEFRLGDQEHEPATPRGEDFVTASVLDPFGNVLGLIQSPHYLEMI
jgi:catechol 2,3-dioxygenase-like lactoylglutathione lyase family enzyme